MTEPIKLAHSRHVLRITAVEDDERDLCPMIERDTPWPIPPIGTRYFLPESLLGADQSAWITVQRVEVTIDRDHDITNYVCLIE